jgi:succinylarginine dihydrolase
MSMLVSLRPSDRPTLPLTRGVGSSGAEESVLKRLCLNSNQASDRPTVSPLRPSDHTVLLSSLLLLCNSSDASRIWTIESSDGVC